MKKEELPPKDFRDAANKLIRQSREAFKSKKTDIDKLYCLLEYRKHFVFTSYDFWFWVFCCLILYYVRNIFTIVPFVLTFCLLLLILFYDPPIKRRIDEAIMGELEE